MSIPLSDITQAITVYSQKFPSSDLQPLQPLLEAINTSDDITARTNLPGHVTTSAVIINKENMVLHTKHRILNTWLLPGGLLSMTILYVLEPDGIQRTS
jgi:hypothetical protein